MTELRPQTAAGADTDHVRGAANTRASTHKLSAAYFKSALRLIATGLRTLRKIRVVPCPDLQRVNRQ